MCEIIVTSAVKPLFTVLLGARRLTKSLGELGGTVNKIIIYIDLHMRVIFRVKE